jgi:hypothetical protein
MHGKSSSQHPASGTVCNALFLKSMTVGSTWYNVKYAYDMWIAHQANSEAFMTMLDQSWIGLDSFYWYCSLFLRATFDYFKDAFGRSVRFRKGFGILDIRRGVWGTKPLIIRGWGGLGPSPQEMQGESGGAAVPPVRSIISCRYRFSSVFLSVRSVLH